jgi:hypothetical protein
MNEKSQASALLLLFPGLSITAIKESLNKLIPFMVRQAHHERNQHKPFVLSLSKDCAGIL